MNSRLGIACLMACSTIALAVAACSHYSNNVVTPTPSPSPSGSPAPDTLYVQESTTKAIRVYKGASAINGLALSQLQYPTQDASWGDVVYNPVSDTLWYATAFLGGGNGPNQSIETWDAASTKNGMNPDFKVPFQNSEGTLAFD